MGYGSGDGSTGITRGGGTVLYGSASEIRDTLEYDFSQEKNFSYKQNTKTIPFYAVFCLPLLKEKEEKELVKRSKINI